VGKCPRCRHSRTPFLHRVLPIWPTSRRCSSAKREWGRLSRPNWLDGVVAGFGAAAVCAAFAFHSILHAAGGKRGRGGDNLAYPIGDLSYCRWSSAARCCWLGVQHCRGSCSRRESRSTSIGDTANLFSSSTIFASKLGSDFNAVAWPASILLMSMSVWLKPRTLDPLRAQRVAGVALPSVAAIGGLAILLIGYVHTVPWVALWLRDRRHFWRPDYD